MRHIRRWLVLAVVMAVSASVGVGLAARHTQNARAASAAAGPGCGQWSIVPSANPGMFNDALFGIAAVSPSDIWAVGDEGDQAGGPNFTLTEHWNGTSWGLVASPNVSNAEQNELLSASAVSTNDVWAVGDYFDTTLGMFLPLTEHWNGTSWSIVSTPSLGQMTGSLNSVSADASNDVWAAGMSSDPVSGASQTLVERWNGTSWSIISSPNVASSYNLLNSVVALSASDVWAVGEYFASAGFYQTLIEHWDGSTWSIVSSPSVSQADNYLNGVTAVASGNVWAVGHTVGSAGTPNAALTEHWNGSTWSIVSSYTDSQANLVVLQAAAAVPGTQQVLSVGDESIGTTSVTLATRWNGTTWTRMQTDSPSSTGNGLIGVAALSSFNAWAVGSYIPPAASAPTLMRLHRRGIKAGIPQERTLILHYLQPRLGIACSL